MFSDVIEKTLQFSAVVLTLGLESAPKWTKGRLSDASGFYMLRSVEVAVLEQPPSHAKQGTLKQTFAFFTCQSGNV